MLSRPVRQDPLDLVFGPLEAKVMSTVWRRDSYVTVKDVLDEVNRGQGRQLAYSTVRTIMNNLADKGHLRKRPAGRAHEYAAVHKRSDFDRDLVRRIVQPSAGASNPWLVHLVADLDESNIAELERLLARKRADRHDG